MKRLGNLYDKIISMDNLRLADEKARKGKTKTVGVQKHDKHREENLQKLHEQLKNGTFRTSQYKIFTIHEPKERIIYRLPYYPDRILHHAVMNIMESIWVSTLTSDTFSCIKHRGINGVRTKLKRSLPDKQNTEYCLKIDIRKYYPSIDHDTLKQIIRKKIKCTKTLVLLDEIIDSAPGIPIGNYLSQYFANLYLSYFDHWVKEVAKVKHYFRYAADMIFLSNSKSFLHNLLGRIKTYLQHLKLQLKPNYQVFPVLKRGIDFVGFVFFHTHIFIRKCIKQKLCRTLHKSTLINKELKMRIAGWLGWLKYSNSKHLIQTLHI